MSLGEEPIPTGAMSRPQELDEPDLSAKLVAKANDVTAHDRALSSMFGAGTDHEPTLRDVMSLLGSMTSSMIKGTSPGGNEGRRMATRMGEQLAIMERSCERRQADLQAMVEEVRDTGACYADGKADGRPGDIQSSSSKSQEKDRQRCGSVRLCASGEYANTRSDVMVVTGSSVFTFDRRHKSKVPNLLAISCSLSLLPLSLRPRDSVYTCTLQPSCAGPMPAQDAPPPSITAAASTSSVSNHPSLSTSPTPVEADLRSRSIQIVVPTPVRRDKLSVPQSLKSIFKHRWFAWVPKKLTWPAFKPVIRCAIAVRRLSNRLADSINH